MRTRWNSMSVEWRWRILALFWGFFVVLSYKYNFKKTADLIGSYRQLGREMAAASTVLIQNTRESKNITPLNDSVEATKLLDNISLFCDLHNITISELSQTFFREVENYTIETNKLVVKGKYRDILELIYTVERSSRIVVVNSAVWELKKEIATEKYFLSATIYIKRLRYETT